MKIWKSGKNKRGFTLIEGLTVLFIFSMISLTFYELYALGLKHIQNAKNRLVAISIANEKMELIRNMNYDNIGTVSGSVSGVLLDDEDVTADLGSFHVNTLVEYVQDSFDGVYPADTAFEDYKRVTITVSWLGGQGEVEIVSRFVPAGLEVADPDDGILVINVFSDQPGGSGISGSSVHVVNTETGLNTTVTTDSTGSVMLMGDRIQDSIQKYEITLTKTGHETVNTLPPYPTTAYNPVNTHASVVVGAINVANIVQNELAEIKVSTVNYLDQAVPNIAFSLVGGRVLGNDVSPPNDPVYNFNENEITDSNGEKDFGQVSPGTYAFTLDAGVVDYVMIESDPVSLPLTLFSGNDTNLKIKLADVNASSLLIRINSSVEGNPLVVGAQVQVTNLSGYDVTQTTTASGTVFFPNTEDPFVSGDYHIHIEALGYDDFDSDVTVNLDELKLENIILNPSV